MCCFTGYGNKSRTKKCVAMATQTVMTLQLILDTPLLTEEGKLAAVSERALQTSQNYLCELDRA